MIKKFIVAFIFSISLIFSPTYANELSDVDRVLTQQVPSSGVLDLTGKLDSSVVSRVEEINKTLASGENKIQIGVVAVNDLKNYTIEDAGLKIARHWKIGFSDTNYGMLYIFSINDRKTRLEISDNLSTIITDGEAQLLLDSVKSYYREGDYSSGTKALLDEIYAKKLEPFSKGEEPERMDGADSKNALLLILFIFIIFIVMIVGILFGDDVWPGYTSGGSYSSSRSSFSSRSGGSSWSGGGFSGGGSSSGW